MRTLSISQLWAAPEMKWRETGGGCSYLPICTLSKSMGREMRGMGGEQWKVRNEILFGHAKAILAPRKEGNTKPIGL